MVLYKELGLVAICIIPAFLGASKDNRKLILSATILFIVAELFLFQPLDYDNNKLFFIVYMIFLINCSNWYVSIFDKLKKEKSRYYLLALVIILSTLSGILTIGREMKSGGIYETFNKDMIEMSEYIKKNTESDALFLTGTSHINPVTSLSGRNVYLGATLYLYFHGFGEEMSRREMEVNNIYQGTYEEIVKFCQEKHIKYVYLGINESSLNPNYDAFSKLEKIASFGNEELYQIK